MSDEILASLAAIRDDQREMRQSLTEVARAMTRLAVVEERQANSQGSIARAFKAIESHENRIDALEKSEPDQKRAAKYVHHAVWAAACAAAAFVAHNVGLM